MKIENKQFKSKESSLPFKEKLYILSDFKLWTTNGSKWTERAAHPYTYPKQKKCSLCLQVWVVNDQQKPKTKEHRKCCRDRSDRWAGRNGTFAPMCKMTGTSWSSWTLKNTCWQCICPCLTVLSVRNNLSTWPVRQTHNYTQTRYKQSQEYFFRKTVIEVKNLIV